MGNPLRVLLVEDSEDDAELILHEIRREGYEVEAERVDTRPSLKRELKRRPWDIVICDYNLPQFNAMQAIATLKESGLDIPLIIVTGSVGEEAAVAALKAGARDFLIKSHMDGAVLTRSIRSAIERSQTELHLRELAAIVENSQDAIFRKSLDGIIRTWNKGAEQIYGYSPEEVIGKPVSMLMSPEGRLEMDEVLKKIRRGEKGRHFETERIREDGTRMIMRISVSPILNEKGEAIAASTVARDITVQKQAEEAVQQMRDRFQALTENAPDGVALIEANGHMKFVSPAGRRMFGYDLAESVEISPAEYTHPDDLPAVLSALSRLTENPTRNCTLQYRFRHRDGSWLWIESTFTNLLSVKSVEAIVVNFRDITERRQAEVKIQQQLERLATLREIDQVIASTFDLRVSMNLLLSRAMKLLAVDAIAVLLLDPIQKSLEYSVGLGFRTGAIQKTSVGLGRSLAGRAAAERKIIQLRNIAGEADNQFLTGLMKGEGFMSYHGAPLIVKGKVVGVLEAFGRSIVERDRDWIDFFSTLAGQAAIMVEDARMFNDLQVSNTELSIAYDATIEGWSRALDLRDKETEGHTKRVTDLTVQLARLMGLPEGDLIHIRRGALLHDMGKLGVPDHILLKTGPLSEAEWEVMKRHPVFAYELLSPIRYLKSAAIDIPYCHHEKWDGTGYPRGLRGEEIPLAARLFAVVDVWDAITSDRPYRPAWAKEKAVGFIRGQSAKHFDPQVVALFSRLIERLGPQ